MSAEKIIGHINSTESFGSVDGPGVRFIFFLQGCPMRCKYCHNPETWAVKGGDEMTAQEAFDLAYKYKNYWKGGGGITVSGGEAMLQIEFVTELFKLAKEHGVSTALDTSGSPFTHNEPFFSKFQELMKYTDLVILDIKEIDDEKHRKLTGHSNKNILDLARWLSDNGIDMWIRHVLVPTITENDDDLKGLADFIGTLKTVKRVEVLPYHTLGVPKYEKLGIPYPLEGVPTPTKAEVENAKKILNC